MKRFLFLYNLMFILPVVLAFAVCEEKYGPLYPNLWLTISIAVVVVNVILYVFLRKDVE